MAKTVYLLLKNRLQALAFSMFKMSKGKKTSTTKTVLLTLLAVYLFFCIFLFMTFLFAAIAPPLIHAGQQWLYFAIAAAVSLLFCLIGSVFTAQSYLFEAKDNELLLSMPVKPSAILLSRLLMLLVLTYIYELLIMIPSAVAYSFFAAFTPFGLLCFVLGAFLLPLLAVALSCVLGWLMGLLFARLRRKNIVVALLMFALIGLYLYLYTNLQSYLDQLVANSEQIAQVVRQFLPPAYSFGCAVGQQDVLHMLLLILWCVLPIGAVYWFLSKRFVRMVTATKTLGRVKYKEQKLRKNSVKMALLKKEIAYFLSMPSYILNCSFGTIMAVLAAGVMLFEGDKLLVMLRDVSPGLTAILPVLWCAVISLCCAMNDVSAPSISLEGKTLWILKAQPVPVMDIFFAKSLTNLIVSAPGIVVAAVVGAIVMPFGVADILLLLLVPALVCVFSGMLGVCVNLLCPRFDWVNETAVIKQSASVLIALLAGIILSAPPFVIAFVLALFASLVSAISGTLALVFCVLYFILLNVLLYLFMRFKGQKIFARLS